MPATALGRRRPRPVADAPALDGRELARAWLVELVAAAPLERAAELPGPGFARDASRLCAAAAAALAGEEAFDDLEPGGRLAPLASTAGALAGASDAAEAVAALEALRAVAWAAIVAACGPARPGQLADLADRLGAVVATLATASLEAGDDPSPAPSPADRGPLAAVLRAVERRPSGTASGASSPVAGEPAGDASGAASPVAGEPPAEASGAASAASGRAPAPARLASPGARAPGAPVDDALESLSARIHDAVSFGARVAPWTAAIERRLARHREDGRPFAVLCVEVADLDRLVAAERDRDVGRALEAAEAAVCGQLRPADALLRERPGRYWLVAPDTDGDAARSLAHLLAAAVAGVEGHRGTPLELAVGMATCPADAADAPALEGRAEEGVYAARAAGVRVAAPPQG